MIFSAAAVARFFSKNIGAFILMGALGVAVWMGGHWKELQIKASYEAKLKKEVAAMAQKDAQRQEEAVNKILQFQTSMHEAVASVIEASKQNAEKASGQQKATEIRLQAALNQILLRSRKDPLIVVDSSGKCTLTPEFAKSWNSLNEIATK
jgi:23S rRNA pseudoU1915 N3-methylase RlmH